MTEQLARLTEQPLVPQASSGCGAALMERIIVPGCLAVIRSTWRPQGSDASFAEAFEQ
jgi:hypothetical protein